jgi:predicted nucleic acid-binding protein
MWHEYKTQKRPPYVKTNSGKKRTEMNFELALIYPMNRWATKSYTRDKLGRNIELKIDDEKQRIKYIIPYWEEELIYDFDAKNRIRYHQMMRHIMSIQEIAQIFTLNNKIFVQVENDIKMYGNKNLDDTTRLFEIMKNELLRKNKTNFIFVKDITTHQRILLYNLLESKGYKRSELFRHYSY